MYQIKRIFEKIIEQKDVPGAASVWAADGLQAVEEAERRALEEPQEMRDLFAAAALFGLVGQHGDYNRIDLHAWNLSDRMMAERRNRIEARKAGQS